jgi:hypothetical protein
MPTHSLIADLFAAVERAEERVREKSEAPTEECSERSACFPQPQGENSPKLDPIAQTRANIDRYWRNHFGVSATGSSAETISSEAE